MVRCRCSQWLRSTELRHLLLSQQRTLPAFLVRYYGYQYAIYRRSKHDLSILLSFARQCRKCGNYPGNSRRSDDNRYTYANSDTNSDAVAVTHTNTLTHASATSIALG